MFQYDIRNTKKYSKFVTSTHIRGIHFSFFAHNFTLSKTKNYLIFEHISQIDIIVFRSKSNHHVYDNILQTHVEVLLLKNSNMKHIVLKHQLRGP